MLTHTLGNAVSCELVVGMGHNDKRWAKAMAASTNDGRYMANGQQSRACWTRGPAQSSTIFEHVLGQNAVKPPVTTKLVVRQRVGHLRVSNKNLSATFSRSPAAVSYQDKL